MLLKQISLAVIGGCAGGIIAAGVFSFLAIIGIYPRLIGKSKTHRHMMLYETLLILGGILGNLLYLFDFSISLSYGIVAQLILTIFGMGAGIFVGCLVMSLSETLKVLPVMNRRIRLAVGLQYVILSLAVGKLIGALLYFYYGMAA